MAQLVKQDAGKKNDGIYDYRPVPSARYQVSQTMRMSMQPPLQDYEDWQGKKHPPDRHQALGHDSLARNSLHFGGDSNHFNKILFQAGAADKRAINIRMAHVVTDIGWIGAATILNP